MTCTRFEVTLSPRVRKFTSTIDTRAKQFTSEIRVGRQGPAGPPGSDGEQGPPGPPGPPGADGGETLTVTGPNTSGGPIVAGQAVAMAAAGVGFVLASFADLTRRGVGIAQAGGAHGEDITVVILGVVEVDDWEDATGGNWLPPNTRLWLAADGSLTTSPTAVAGQYNQSLGSVLAPQKLIVLPGGVLIMSE